MKPYPLFRGSGELEFKKINFKQQIQAQGTKYLQLQITKHQQRFTCKNILYNF